MVGVKSLQPYVAPFAVDSYALQREVLHSGLPERMLGGVERLDLVGIALLPGELRKPVGVSRPLVEPADYRGARIATRLSELGLRTFRALGATGKAIVPGSDTSSFDGFETDITGLQDDYDGAPRTLAANVNLWPRALVIVMNRDAYEGLSDDQRRHCVPPAAPRSTRRFSTSASASARRWESSAGVPSRSCARRPGLSSTRCVSRRVR